jgi:hypothetical protein
MVIRLGVLLLSLLVIGTQSEAAPAARLWARWQAHKTGSTTAIDHSQWRQFLARNLVTGPEGINRIGYADVSRQDRQLLDNYLGQLASQGVMHLNRNEQLSFWINLYNALTIDLVLDHYPVRSIRDIDISPGWFADGPWEKKLINIEGVAVSLDDIEHRILRPVWKDPRIHYALNCASLGCPNLQSEPFTSQNSEQLLEQAARDYINHARGVRVVQGKLVVSSIYKWFKEDFGGSDAALIRHFRRYAEPELKSLLERIDKIGDDAYNWLLNDVP